MHKKFGLDIKFLFHFSRKILSKCFSLW